MTKTAFLKKKIEDCWRPPFWKSLNRHISVKNRPILMFVRFWWNLVYYIRYWTRWQSRDQKLKFLKFKMAAFSHWLLRWVPCHTLWPYRLYYITQPYKNLGIANRSRVSCAHNMSRGFIGLSITPWPWNLRKGSLKVSGNGTIGQIIHDLLLVELFDVKYYRDLEMWVRGHSRSLKVVPFGREAWVWFSIRLL